MPSMNQKLQSVALLEPDTELFGISLMSMLTVPRFSRTLHEEALVKRLLLIDGAWQDAHGNVHIRNGASRVIFSAHTDTVHKQRDVTPYDVQYSKGVLSRGITLEGKGGGVLGADCASGIFIMLAMLAADVKGHYVFHRDEEIGGRGSAFAASCINEGEYDMCVAFDRRGYGDVITSMARGKTASDEFATALADQLNTNLKGADAGYQADPTGVFTDSANYTEVVPECTNISVGYDCEHSLYESQDFEFMRGLIASLIQVDWAALPVVRDVTDSGYAGGSWWDKYDTDSYMNPADRAALADLLELTELCKDNPEGVAEFLYYQSGADPAELREYLDVINSQDIPF